MAETKSLPFLGAPGPVSKMALTPVEPTSTFRWVHADNMFINHYSNSIITLSAKLFMDHPLLLTRILHTFPIDAPSPGEQSSVVPPGAFEIPRVHTKTKGHFTTSYSSNCFIFTSALDGDPILCRSTHHGEATHPDPLSPFTSHTLEMPQHLHRSQERGWAQKGRTSLTSLAFDDGQGIFLAMDELHPGEPYA